MCIQSRGEIFTLSVVCALYNVVYLLMHGVNMARHRGFIPLHCLYVGVHSVGFTIAVLFFVSILTRRATPMEVGLFLSKARIIFTSMEVGYIGYRTVMGMYDLPVHFFKQPSGQNAMPVASFIELVINRHPRNERNWRKFHHLCYLFTELGILIIDVYATWRMDLFVNKQVVRELFG